MLLVFLITLFVVVQGCPFKDFVKDVVGIDIPSTLFSSQYRDRMRKLQAPQPKQAPTKPAPSTPEIKPAPSTPEIKPAPGIKPPPSAPASAPNPAQLLSNPVCLRAQPKVTICQVNAQIESEFNTLINQSNNQQKAAIFGAALRLSFHDAGEFMSTSSDLLGPDGCLSTSNTDNVGLIEPTSVVVTIFEPMWQKYCSSISRADFWALMGKLSAQSAVAAGGVQIAIPFHYGRKDSVTCNVGAGRLPQALTTSFSTTTGFFSANLGLTLQDTVTLLGAHSVGKVSPNKSGFGINPPPNDPLVSNTWDITPHILDNKYYVALLDIPWTLAPAQTGQFTKKQDYVDQNGKTIMLNSDMSMAYVIDPSKAGVPSVGRCGGQGNRIAFLEFSHFISQILTPFSTFYFFFDNPQVADALGLVSHSPSFKVMSMTTNCSSLTLQRHLLKW